MAEDTDYEKALKAMGKLSSIDQVRVMRTCIGNVFAKETSDEIYDNGMLVDLSTFACQAETVIISLNKHNGK